MKIHRLISSLLICSLMLCFSACNDAPSESESVKTMSMKISETRPSAVAITNTCFYAHDESGASYRVLWDDPAFLSENATVIVKYTEIRTLEYPDGYPTGPTPQYEMDAVDVERKWLPL